MIRRILFISFTSLFLAVGCATLDGVNLTGVDDAALSKNTSLILISVFEMKETDKQGLVKMDGKTIEPAGKYYLSPGKHRVTVRYRKNTSGRWLSGTTTVTLKAGSVYVFSAFSSGYGMMTMMMEKSFFIKGRLDQIRSGMTKDQVTKIMKVKPKYTMTVGKKGTPNRTESWSYYNKKEQASISFSSKGSVTRTYWNWIKKKK